MSLLSEKGEFYSVACESGLIIFWDDIFSCSRSVIFVNQVKKKLNAMKEELDNTDGVSQQSSLEINISFLIHLSHNFFFWPRNNNIT